MSDQLEASFSTLLMSVASSSLISMGITPNPSTGKTEKDPNMARFNIDLILMLKEKTQGNLTEEEQKFLDHLVGDLQMKYLQMKKEADAAAQKTD